MPMDLAGYGPPLTVAEVEAANMVRLPALGPDPVPFGYCNDQWRALLAQRQPGDELREFCSSPGSWQHLAGRAGIALVRSGREVASIVTMLN
jgi:hypothetical protein